MLIDRLHGICKQGELIFVPVEDDERKFKRVAFQSATAISNSSTTITGLSWRSGRQDRPYEQLTDLLLMTHLSQSPFPFVSRHFVALSLFATWHKLLLSLMVKVVYWNAAITAAGPACQLRSWGPTRLSSGTIRWTL